MKALILAAGYGSRLRPITDSVPKCLVQVNGRTILEQQIKCLQLAKISDITVVGGYKFDILADFLSENFPSVNLIENRDYEKTNNMFSFYLTREYIENSSLILINGDVYISPENIQAIVNAEAEKNHIAIEKDAYADESMKVQVSKDNGNITHISKSINKQDAFGVSIDLYRFTHQTTKLLYKIAEEYIVHKDQSNLWTEYAINDALKIEKFSPLCIQGPWYEIDNLEDLKNAQELFRNRHDP